MGCSQAVKAVGLEPTNARPNRAIPAKWAVQECFIHGIASFSLRDLTSFHSVTLLFLLFVQRFPIFFCTKGSVRFSDFRTERLYGPTSCRCSLMAKHLTSNQKLWVRFPSLAPQGFSIFSGSWHQYYSLNPNTPTCRE